MIEVVLTTLRSPTLGSTPKEASPKEP